MFSPSDSRHLTLKKQIQNEQARFSMLPDAHPDPHYFCLTNTVVMRLKCEILERLEWRQEAPAYEYQLYSHVRDSEAALLCSLQSSEDDTSSAYTKGMSLMLSMLDKYVAHNIQTKLRESDQSMGDTIILFVEAIITLYQQLRCANSWREIYLDVTQFIRVMTGKSITCTFSAIFEHVKSLIVDVMNTCASLQSGTSNPFSRFRYYFAKCEEAQSHPMVKKIQKIFYYLMSFSLLERFGLTFNTFWYSKAEAELMKNKHSNKMDFVSSVIDGTTFILERLYDCATTGSWSPIIHSGHSYGKWVDEVYLLKEQSHQLHNPEANGLTYHEFLGRLDNCIEQGEAIVKFATEVDPSTKTLLKRLLSDMRLMKANECTKVAARQQRETPFAILYFGGSSIGKSTLTDLCYHHFAKVHDLPEGDEYTYTRSFSDEYWSGFQTSAWSIVLDDVAARNPNACQEDKSISEILQIINQVAFTPPQADLADKGRTPLRPRLVQASTNTKNLMAHAWYNNQLAILRRFPIVVTPTVKAEYCVLKDGQVPEPLDRQLDNSRCPVLQEGEYPDFWDFTVEKVVSTTQGEGTNMRQYATYAAYWADAPKITSIYEFLARIGRESMLHKEKQHKVMAGAKLYSSLAICKQCFHPHTRCACAALQSEEMEVALVSITMLGFCGFVYSHATSVRAWFALIWRYFLAYVSRVVYDSGTTIMSNVAQIAKEEATAKVTECARTVKEAIAPCAASISKTVGDCVDTANDTAQRISAELEQTLLKGKERYEYERIRIREAIVKLGEKARSHRVSSTIFLAFLTAAPLILGAAHIWKSFTTNFAQGSAEEGARPEAKDEKPNPWYRDDYEPSTFDVGMLTSSWKALSVEQIAGKIFRNCLYATAHYQRDGQPKKRQMRLFCVGGNLFVTNNHNIPELDVTLKIVSATLNSGVGQNFEFRLAVNDAYRLKDRDLMFFRIGCMPPRANLLDLLPGESFRTVCKGALLGRSEEGKETTNALQAIRFNERHFTPDLNANFPSWEAVAERDTVSGECGSVIMAFTPSGPMVVGLHQTGGSLRRVSSVQLTRECADAAIKHFDTHMIQCGTPDLTDKFGQPIQLGPIHHKSVFRYIENGTGNVYGSLPGFRPAHKSSVRKTHIADAMVERGYEIKTGAPVMKGWEPWRHAATDIVEQVFRVDQTALDNCADSFAEDILARLDASQLAELIVLDNATTLNGYPGTKFIDKMNRRTSMGFPYREKKLKYLTYKGKVDVWDDYVEFHDGFYERVDGIIANYEQGIRYMPVYTGHLKDEALKKSKIADKKTRVFSSGPAEWCFTVRKYLLTFVRVVQNNKYTFESAPGTNAASAEWDQIYHYLTQFGTDRIIAGDYSKFDKRMSAQWILAAFRVIDRILAKAGWDDRQRRIVQCIGYDIAFPLTDFNGDLVEFWGSNPSGHPLTVIVNGLVNALLMRYVWVQCGNDLSNFKKQVSLMTYGDDNIMGVHRSVSNFDHTIIVAKLAAIGVVYTMADKEAESVPFINIGEVSFLKRCWRYEPEIGHHVAQLEHDSIAKMLTMHLPSKVVCEEQHAVDVMHTALSEYFFYGRKEFDERRRMFLEVIEELGLAPYYARAFPTFDEILTGYVENSEDVYPGARCPRCS